ncbi:putative eukaryotic translation initiation factor 3 subunit CLU1/TIF31 [Phyllosticta capitalensis]|uniref:putative eukaryotic translation initiation factor 3 subunit CLU1/TIF31 n=1 Tax=Phyllosticta capitalensis TaxID=121624 RepID=UPI003131CDE6
MAQTNDATTPAHPEPTVAEKPVNGDAVAEQNGEQAQADGTEQPVETVFTLNVKLPHEPFKTQVYASSQEQIQELRQSIIDTPQTFQYSCFHLQFNGERINDFVELAEVPGIGHESELALVEDPYTEKEARMHFVRVRELIGAAGNRTDTAYGVTAGVSLLHDVAQKYPSNGQSAPAKAEAKTESTPLDDYKFEASASIQTLLPQAQDAAPKTVKAISLSPWNPPPYHLRQKGHLLYLQVTTNEGEQYQVTSHVSGFYVNKSTNNKFDPFPRTAPKDIAAHSLLTLLSKLSPSFKESFQALLEYNNAKDPLAMFQLSNAIPASPWLVPPPSSAANTHQADIARTQENYLVSGLENTDSLRDWNEEFQSTRELPRETVQDRVFRERLTSKLFADYNEAAVRGAVLVARGEVAPLNPTESKDAQIFVWNNIFFSFGADGVGTFATDGGDEAARVATGKDVQGVKAVNQLDINGLFTPGTVVIDYLGKRIVGQSIVPGIFKQREPGEHQIDYGGVEGKDVVAENESFVPLFAEMSKALRVKKHAVWDKENKRHELEGSVETKGLLGTDGRKYALDLYRISPLDIAWLEQYWQEPTEGEKEKEKNYPHRMAVLRPELVESYGRVKLREYIRVELEKKAKAKEAAKSEEKTEEKPKEDGEKAAEEEKQEPEKDRVDISGFQFALNPDVFTGQVPQTDEEKEEYARDESDVRAACQHLTDEVIPRLVHDLQEGDVGFPMDGQSLTSLLHKRGINIRYLGKVASLSDNKDEPRLEALRRLAIQEMIARGFKHVANQKIRYLPSPFIGAAVAHLLNCLLGGEVNANPTVEIDSELRALYADADFSFEQVTPESLKQAVVDEVFTRFRFEVGNNWIEAGKHFQILREVSLKLGIQLEAKDYAFTKEQAASAPKIAIPEAKPATNGHSKGKKKKGGEKSPSPTATPATPAQVVTFRPDDVQNVVPIVKEASPKSILADEALEAGRISIAQDQKQLGQELLLESLSLHEQIYGVLHPEVARVYHQLSTLLYSLDEKVAAVDLAHKAVIVAERTLGVDSSETVLSYLNLSLFEHANGNTKVALGYVRHALELWKVIYGNNHPDSITTINNAAVMLQTLKQYHESRQWFETCLAVSEEVSGKQSSNTATLLFQLSQALALDKDMHAAVNRMRESYTLFNQLMGPEDRNTKEAESWLEQLTQSAVMHAKQIRDVQAGRLRRIPLTPRQNLRPQPRVGQTVSEATGRTAPNAGAPDAELHKKSIEELVKYIEGDTQTKSSKKKQQKPRRPGRAGGN